MSETKFTPGPWQRVGWKPTGIYGPGDLATAERIGRTDERREHDANAHLIAAAPDLYAALDGLEAYLRETPHHNAPEAAAARHALRKARGESA